MTYDSLRDQLSSYGQEHVLLFWNQLDDRGRKQLESQINSLDLDLLASLIAGEDSKPDFAALAQSASPPPAVRADGVGAAWSVEEARRRGEDALRAGQVGAVIVAGGQGTRLGFDQPKGMFKIGPVSGRTLFQFFADRLNAIAQTHDVCIPLYLMTSDATDAATREFFEANDFLGLSPDDVRIFQQGTMPAIDSETGKLLLASKDSLALSPDGHGGTVGALDRNGCLRDADSRGVRYLSYIQVDNPLAALCDPVLVGHHVMAGSEMTTHVVKKRFPMEKVGNVVNVDGRVQIIEYSDLPAQAAEARTESGELRLWAGNIGVHVIDVDFLKRMSGSSDAMPFHRARKKVSFVDDAGQIVEPEHANAIKFERFIFDMLPAANNAFVVEALASQAFAPVKNADGAPTDTPAAARAAIVDLHRGWLEAVGAVVDQGVQVEINPRFSLSPAELAEKIPANLRVDSDRYFDV